MNILNCTANDMDIVWTTMRKRDRKKVGRPMNIQRKPKNKIGLKAKFYHKQCHAEKIQMKKTIKMHEKRNTKQKDEQEDSTGSNPCLPAGQRGAVKSKILFNMIKQKRKEKVGKWKVPLPKVRAQGETEVLKVIRTGKRKEKAWMRMVTKRLGI